jgi:hypothetical protein
VVDIFNGSAKLKKAYLLVILILRSSLDLLGCEFFVFVSIKSWLVK